MPGDACELILQCIAGRAQRYLSTISIKPDTLLLLHLSYRAIFYIAPTSPSLTPSAPSISYLYKQRRSSSLKMSICNPIESSIPEPSRRMGSSPVLQSGSWLRNASHPRSSSESAVVVLEKAISFASPTQTSDSGEDDHERSLTSPLVRKRSGQVVKPAQRPYFRRAYSSLPNTPTYSKSVHFNDSGNETRQFFQGDEPVAVVRASSPIEVYNNTTYGIRYSFDRTATSEHDLKPVQLEHLSISSDQQKLIGTCIVQNLSFHKRVAVHFTFDDWTTISEVEAEYYNEVRNPLHDRCDRFRFHIKLSHQANVEEKLLLLCIRYNVGGEEFWDNNNDINYRVDVSKTTYQPPRHLPSSTGDLETRQINTAQYHEESPSLASNDLNTHLLSDIACKLNPTAESSERSPKATLHSDLGDLLTGPPAKDNGENNILNTPSSFPVPATLDESDRQNSLMPNHRPTHIVKDRQVGPARRITPPATSVSYSIDGPAMGSDQYRRLIQRFCYVSLAMKIRLLAWKTKRCDENADSDTSSFLAPRVDVCRHGLVLRIQYNMKVALVRGMFCSMRRRHCDSLNITTWRHIGATQSRRVYISDVSKAQSTICILSCIKNTSKLVYTNAQPLSLQV